MARHFDITIVDEQNTHVVLGYRAKNYITHAYSKCFDSKNVNKNHRKYQYKT